jgi:hypothetical protein
MRVGIEIEGAFTESGGVDAERFARTWKVPSTPSSPAVTARKACIDRNIRM